MENNFLLREANLTGIMNWLNENYKKKNSSKTFTLRDVKDYIIRGRLPAYIARGGIKIKKIEKRNCTIKLYNVYYG